jgi:hypothetical protein
MASGPPNRGSLTIKNLDRQEAEEVISCFVLLGYHMINLKFWLSNIFTLLSFISLYKAFHSSEKLKSLGPRCSSLANLFSPVFGRTLNKWIFGPLFDYIHQEAPEFILLGLLIYQIVVECAQKVVCECAHLVCGLVLQYLA